MKNYINADLYTIFKRIPRWVMLAIVLFIIGAIFWPSSDEDYTIIELVDTLEQVLRYAPVYLGFIEMIYIFGDDFTGKTAQIAIGIGVKRRQVVMAKWLEAIIVVAADIVMIVVLSLGLSVIQTHSLPIELVADIIVHMLISILTIAAYIALVFPIMFMMQNITVAFLIYMLLSSGAINKLIDLLSNLEKIRFLNVGKYTLTNCITVFRSRLALGSFKFESAFGIVIYIAAALCITCLLYKKKELEF